MSATAKLDRHRAAEFLDGLRRDISAARLRVTLDEKLGRDTPAAVKKLAALPEPPAIEAEEGEPEVSVAAAAAQLVDEEAPLRTSMAAFFANVQESGGSLVIPMLVRKVSSAGPQIEQEERHGAHQAP